MSLSIPYGDLIKRLGSAPKELLVKALADLSHCSKAAELTAIRLSVREEDLAQTFKDCLQDIIANEPNYSYKHHQEFVDILCALLEFLRMPNIPPRDRVECLICFFEADHCLMEKTHDDGEVGMLYHFEATELLRLAFEEINNAEFKLKTLERLLKTDAYGARIALADF